MAYMSQEGYDKLVAQLKEMETVQRPAASAAIAEARDKGDLSENSEYDAAKEHQAMLEMKKIRDEFDYHGGRAIGSREMLDIRDAEYGGEMLYINKS